MNKQPSSHEIKKTLVEVLLIIFLEKIYTQANEYAEICNSYCKDIKGYREGVSPSDIRKVAGGILYKFDRDNKTIKDNFGLKL